MRSFHGRGGCLVGQESGCGQGKTAHCANPRTPKFGRTGRELRGHDGGDSRTIVSPAQRVRTGTEGTPCFPPFVYGGGNTVEASCRQLSQINCEPVGPEMRWRASSRPTPQN